MSANDLKLKGQHQIANALVAFAVTEICGVPRDSICQTLKGFEGLPHRTQFVTENNGVIYINDSKGTNVGATQAAIEGFSQPIVLIAGGVGKGADFSALRACVKDKVKQVVLIGEDAKLIADALEGDVELQFANDMVDAVSKASAVAEPGDIVLLSPACASFDMFDDYQHRGNVFVEAVGRLVSHEY
jgi:UDP-N-acetylmuramoylalanine--D-glutamate ligase